MTYHFSTLKYKSDVISTNAGACLTISNLEKYVPKTTQS